MRIGYARVSTEDQHLDLQRDALRLAGCDRVFDEKVSGANSHRPALQACLRALRRGDVLVVWKLDRLGRSLQDLLKILSALERRGIGFCSLSDSIDTTTAAGKFIYQVTGAFAEFERKMISERTKAGMQAARRKGRSLGRPRRMNEQQIEQARDLARSGDLSLQDIATLMSVGKTTVWRALHLPLTEGRAAVSMERIAGPRRHGARNGRGDLPIAASTVVACLDGERR